ncbi:hypothetical protein Asi03nite_72450 [Actinoplanes siamensis]|uniref:Uncharacterized protein n=1 Tax=Actinoplanes siamensis TaxID=1223317 RepID=A0A919NF67_9ACTN|nr:hypothetical protein Asi03nite_72450 [Actinoplanes siamensis]
MVPVGITVAGRRRASGDRCRTASRLATEYPAHGLPVPHRIVAAVMPEAMVVRGREQGANGVQRTCNL